MNPRMIALLMLAGMTFSQSFAYAQEVQRYVGPDRKPRAVDAQNRLPVSNAPLSDPAAAADSIAAHQSSSGVLLIGSAVFYSVSITLAAGQGPGRMMLWDRNSVPASGALAPADRPMRCFYVDAGDRTTVFSSASGLGMDSGIAWAFSTSGNCQTLTPATADMVAVSYRR